MQAVVKIGASQYLVTPGQELIVDKLESPVDSKIELNQVLMVSDGDNVTIGKPYIDGIIVSAVHLSQAAGEKIRVSTYKAKSRHRRTIGFRSKLSRIKIESIDGTPAKRSRKVV